MELEQQIANKCIHFNGIFSNTCCKAGVAYADVRVGKPYKFPCLNQSGECAKRQFRTPEELKIYLEELESMSNKTLAAYLRAREHFFKTKDNPGETVCECGGRLKYTVAESNGHMWAKCSSCGVSFNE